VTNAAMARALGKALGRPAKLPVPAFMVRMMAGELGNVMLASQRTLPVRLLRAGFEFDYRHIDGALAAIVGP
jgi:NAD dependent epimerase/dehydratase family enzyme